MTKPTILIADDNPQLRKALDLRLHAAGFDVLIAEDAYQAVSMARQHLPDVLLLDVNMPAGKGFSVHERIANCDELADTPVIYLTGETTADVDDTAFEMGALAVVHKPFRLGDLIEIIQSAIDKHGSGDFEQGAHRGYRHGDHSHRG